MKTFKGATLFLAVCLAAAVVLRLLIFSASLSRLPVDSDEAITLLQAGQIRAGDRPLLIMNSPYSFPLESYLLAPFADGLPRTPFGARVLRMLTGMATLVLLLVLMRRLWGLGRAWPGTMLMLFPSSYLLLLQFGVALPQYPPSFLLWTAAAALAARAREGERRGPAVPALLSGACAGLAFSLQMTSAAVLLPLAAGLAFDERPRRGAASLAAFAAGLALGGLPFILSKLLVPGAYTAVSRRFSVGTALGRLWWPALSFTLPSAMGVNPVYFPDNPVRLPGLAWRNTAFAATYLALLVTATWLVLGPFLRRLARREWPALAAPAIFVGTSWAGLALFALGRRAGSGAARFLLALVWAFPFLVGFVFTRLRGLGRWATALLAAAVAAASLWGARDMTVHWGGRRNISVGENLPNLDPAIALLKERGIAHCYAEYAVAYRLTFVTGGEITCSEPLNERFPGWPAPYKKEVDASREAAYVLQRASERFPAEEFERDLAGAGIGFRVTRAGRLRVYDGFSLKQKPGALLLEGDELRVRADAGGSDPGRLNDRRQGSLWSSPWPQERGMSIQMELDGPRALSGVVLSYPRQGPGPAASLDVHAHTADGWRRVLAGASPVMSPIEFRNGRPIYGRRMQTFWFETVTADALRLEVAEAEEGKPWMIGEVGVYAVP